jgi:hypothetical protein
MIIKGNEALAILILVIAGGCQHGNADDADARQSGKSDVPAKRASIEDEGAGSVCPRDRGPCSRCERWCPGEDSNLHGVTR